MTPIEDESFNFYWKRGQGVNIFLVAFSQGFIYFMIAAAYVILLPMIIFDRMNLPKNSNINFMIFLVWLAYVGVGIPFILNFFI